MKLVNALVFIFFVVCIVFFFFIQSNENFDLRSLKVKFDLSPPDFDVGNLMKLANTRNFTKKKMAVIVPYRNALEDLLQFVPHLTKFLNKQQIPFHIFYINQMDLYRFNRASLINVGFLYIKEKFDYMVTHDGDLLPLNQKLSYEFPPEGFVYHVAANYLHPHKFLDADVNQSIISKIFINFAIFSHHTWVELSSFQRKFTRQSMECGMLIGAGGKKTKNFVTEFTI